MFKFVALSLFVVSVTGGPIEYASELSSDELQVVESYKNVAMSWMKTLNEQEDISSFDETKIKFYLYTREQPSRHRIILNNRESLRNSSYNVRRSTKILIHDWFQNENIFATNLISAYLNKQLSERVNVITVDYGMYAGAKYHEMLQIYAQIGEQVANMMKDLVLYADASPADFHLIGMGLGAHIAAVAAKQMMPFKVARITGLDPAGPGFDSKPTRPQLAKNDAEFIDVIHTNMGEYGTRQVNGDVEFLPNGGASQPVIDFNTKQGNSFISHKLSKYFYIESIEKGNTLKGTKANSWMNYVMGNNPTPEETAYLGEYVSEKAKGNYFLKTNDSPPFGTNEFEDRRQLTNHVEMRKNMFRDTLQIQGNEYYQ